MYSTPNSGAHLSIRNCLRQCTKCKHRELDYEEIPMLESMAVKKDFQTWHRIGWQHSRQPIRSHVWKSLWTDIEPFQVHILHGAYLVYVIIMYDLPYLYQVGYLDIHSKRKIPREHVFHIFIACCATLWREHYYFRENDIFTNLTQSMKKIVSIQRYHSIMIFFFNYCLLRLYNSFSISLGHLHFGLPMKTYYRLPMRTRYGVFVTSLTPVRSFVLLLLCCVQYRITIDHDILRAYSNSESK